MHDLRKIASKGGGEVEMGFILPVEAGIAMMSRAPKMTRCVDGEGAADSDMFFLRANIHNKPEISDHFHTHVPEPRTHTHTHTHKT